LRDFLTLPQHVRQSGRPAVLLGNTFAQETGAILSNATPMPALSATKPVISAEV